MEQPLFSCTKCYRNFPQSEMSRSGQTCKACNPHHSTFKQCEYCKSDFKHYVYGNLCQRCQSLKAKFGDSQQCTICCLKTAFGNALVCQRCLHYRNRFGEPRGCQSCGQKCAFMKDEVSRQKVEGQVLCWVCTYNFKLVRSREHTDRTNSKRGHDFNVLNDNERSKSDTNEQLKRSRSDNYSTHRSTHQDNPRKATAVTTGHQISAPQTTTHSSLDSAYNENLLTISQLEDEVKALKRLLTQKEADLLNKDRTIAALRSEAIEVRELYDDKLSKAKATAHVEHDRLSTTIRQLQREKVSLNQGMNRRRSSANVAGMASATGLRQSASSVSLLFSPDSPIQVAASPASKTLQNRPTVKTGLTVARATLPPVPSDSPAATLEVKSHDVADDSSPAVPTRRRLVIKDDDDVKQASGNTPSTIDEGLSPSTLDGDTESASPASPPQTNAVAQKQPNSPSLSTCSRLSTEEDGAIGKSDRNFDEDPLGFGNLSDSDNDELID